MCYEYTSRTVNEANDIAVDSTHDNCEDCSSTISNELWKGCLDGSELNVFDSTSAPNENFAYICSGGSWVKGYFAQMTSQIASNVSYWEQCDLVGATDCSDLVGIPITDDFDGVDCNSGSYEDENWNLRNPSEIQTNSTTVVASDELSMNQTTATSAWVTDYRWQPTTSITGDFVWQALGCSITHQNGNQAQDNFFFGILNSIDIAKTRYANGDQEIRARVTGGYSSFTTTAGSFDFEISRVGNTVYCKYNVGGGWVTLASGTFTGTVTTLNINIQGDNTSSNSQNSGIDIDELVLEDGSGNNLYRDIAGDSCT